MTKGNKNQEQEVIELEQELKNEADIQEQKQEEELDVLKGELEENQDSDSTDEEEESENEDEAQGIIRTTAIDKVHIPRTIKQIVKNKDKLRFDLCIQRNNVWTPEQKSLFVHSLIYGYPFPPAYAQEMEGDSKELWLLDGKQRLSTIISFCEGGFKLAKKTPKCFGVDIANKKFSELPTEFQEQINDTSFTIYQLRGLTDYERDQTFVRLNKGTPLSKIEQTRAMYSELIEQVETISRLELFQNYVLLSEKAKNRFTDQELILQTAMLLDETNENKGIGSVQIEAYVKDLKAKDELLSDNVFNKFVQADDYLSVLANDMSKSEVKQIFKKVNVPMVIITSLKAIANNVSETIFGDFLVDFLDRNYNKDTVYGKACQSGSAKKENVQIRLDEMDKAFVDYVNERLGEEDEKLQSKHDKLEANVG